MPSKRCPHLSSTALILVEGIPGSGRTSTAQLVAQWLSDNGFHPGLHVEGDLDHPADYESLARLLAPEWYGLLTAYPAWRSRLRGLARSTGREIFVSYRRLVDPPGGLLSALARRDVYELSLPDWQRLTLDRWQEFAHQPREPGEVHVFECCYLQNLLTTPVARFDQPPEHAAAHVLAVARVLQPLRPQLVYLDPPSVPACLHNAAARRPPESAEFVADYTSGQEWGRSRGLSGRSGMLQFYQERRGLEIDLLPALRSGGMKDARETGGLTGLYRERHQVFDLEVNCVADPNRVK